MNLNKATIGQWYADRRSGKVFQVVALDEDEGAIEVQDLDGDVDEIDQATWRSMIFDQVEEPEDWVSPPGERETDDPSYGSEGDRLNGTSSARLDAWSNPIDAAFDLDDTPEQNHKSPP
jgi:hypothetical protein